MEYKIISRDGTVLPKELHDYFLPLFKKTVRNFFSQQNIELPEIQITYLNEFRKIRNLEDWFNQVFLKKNRIRAFASVDITNKEKLDLNIHLDSFIFALKNEIKIKTNFKWFEQNFINEAQKKEKKLTYGFITALNHELQHYVHSILNPKLVHHTNKRITLFKKFKNSLLARHMAERFILDVMMEGVAEYLSKKSYYDSENWKKQYIIIEKNVKNFKKKLYDSKNKNVLIERFGKDSKTIPILIGINITQLLILGKRDPRKLSRQEFFREYEKLCRQVNIKPLMTFKGDGILDYTDMKRFFKDILFGRN